MTSLQIVVPCFNEVESLRVFFDELEQIRPEIEGLGVAVSAVFVDDGSDDGTLDQIRSLMEAKAISGIAIRLSRNFGKEVALTAGLRATTADLVVPMDVDLQDPLQTLVALIQKWRETGCDVVNAVRIDRSSDSFLKRNTARLFYWVHNRISDYPIPPNVGDFRLMTRRVVDAVSAFSEGDRFMKGLVAWVGFHTQQVEYAREPRRRGISRLPSRRLFSLAIDGLLGFSTMPLRMCFYLGLLGILMSVTFLGIVITSRVLSFGQPNGYASVVSIVVFLGSVQLISIGILGEYVGRVFMETKQRPLYVVSDTEVIQPELH